MLSDTTTERRELYRAALWFAPHRAVDRKQAPRRWLWGDTDVWANDVLNAEASSRPHLSVEDATAINSWEWPAQELRPSPDSLDYRPCYFPDAAPSLPLLVHKHVVVSAALAEVTEFVLRLVDQYGQPLPDPQWIPQLGPGESYFSPSQYLGYLNWFATSASDFAEDVDGRRSHFETWAMSGLTLDQQVAADTVSRGVHMSRIGPPATGMLSQMLLGPVL